MQHIVTLILLTLASNVDNAGVGLAYGLRGKSIPFRAISATAILGGTFSAVAVQFAHFLEPFIHPSLASWLSGLILVVLGIHSWRSSWKQVIYYNKLLEKEWWTLAFALSLNNFGLGLGAGFIGYSAILFGIVLGIASGLLLWLGLWVGTSLQLFVIKPWIHQVGSVLLILIGLYQFFY